MGTRIPRSILLHNLLPIENKILFLKLAIAFNLNFKSQRNHRPEFNLKFSIPRPTPYIFVSNLMDPKDEWSFKQNFRFVSQREFQVLLSSFCHYSLKFRNFRRTIVVDNYLVNQGQKCQVSKVPFVPFILLS